MAATLTLVNPLSADDAQRIGLAARAYSIGEIITVEDWAGSTLVRTGYAVAGAAFPNTLLTGTGPPDGGIGANGSYYLDTAAQRLYGPKTAGAWPVALNPGRGITSAAVSGGRLILTYSDGATVDLGNVQGPSGTGTTDSRLDGLTSLATPNVVVLRDGSGRFRAVSPAVAQDVANKDYVDLADLAFRRILPVAVSASRPLAIDDEGDQLVVDSTSAITVTVPPSSSVAFAVGSWVEVVRANTGAVTVAAGSGVTLVGADSVFTLRARYSVVRLRKTATDTWYVEGDVNSSTDSLVAAATSAATASAIARRDSSGRLAVASPSATGDAANKTYVDTADALLIPLSQRGAASGVATLGTDGLIPSAQLPPVAITDTFVVASQAAMLALTAQVGDVAVRTDGTGSWILRLSDPTALASWQQLTAPTDAVISVDGQTGAVSLGDVAASASSLARRQSTGALTVGTPSATTDAVTKAYADALGVSTATASTIARRDSSGRLAVASPSATGDAANKTYVDSQDLAYRREPIARLVTATTATLALADEGDLLNFSGSAAATLTIPPNSSVAFPVGGWVDVQTLSTASPVTIVPGSGVTIRNLVTGYPQVCTDPYCPVRLVKIGTDEWEYTLGTTDTGWITTAATSPWNGGVVWRVKNGHCYFTYINTTSSGSWSAGQLIMTFPVGARPTFGPAFTSVYADVAREVNVGTTTDGANAGTLRPNKAGNGGIAVSASFPVSQG